MAPIEISVGAHVRQAFDWYLPSGRPRLAVLAIHAGGWVEGDKRGYANLPTYFDAFVSAGWAVASSNYRYSSDAPWPAQLQDVTAALEAVRCLTSAPVVIFAESSGGQIGLELLAAQPYVQAAALLYPVTDLRTIATEGGGAPWGAWLAALIPGMDPAAASPICHVRPGTGPTLLIHGSSDTTVPPAQSLQYRQAAVGAGNRSVVVPVPGATHSAPIFVSPNSISLVLSFLGQFESR